MSTMGTGVRSASHHLRSAVGFVRNPRDSLEYRYRRLGPVSTLGRLVFFLGPDANAFVFAHSELFGWREAFDSLVVVDGETALIVSDGADHRRRRRLVAPAFGRRAIEGHTATMRAGVDAAIDSWRPGQVLDLYAELRRVIRRITIEVLFGARLAADEPELGRLLQVALAVIERPPPMQQLQRLGAPSWRRAVAARSEVARRVRVELDHRRGSPDDGARDVLTRLVGSRDEDGSGLRDVEIVDQVISLIAAGYETTSAAAGWAVHALLADPEVARGVREDASGAGWRYVDGVASETLRLHPPAVLSARHVVTAFTFAGRRVPAGRTLIFSPYLTHQLPELWADPLRFDPARWDPTAPGHRRPAPHEFLPFGAGPHRCVGSGFATLELAVLLERIAHRVTLRLEPSDMTPVSLTAMRPRRGPIARVVAVR